MFLRKEKIVSLIYTTFQREATPSVLLAIPFNPTLILLMHPGRKVTWIFILLCHHYFYKSSLIKWLIMFRKNKQGFFSVEFTLNQSISKSYSKQVVVWVVQVRFHGQRGEISPYWGGNWSLRHTSLLWITLEKAVSPEKSQAGPLSAACRISLLLGKR